MYTYIYINPKGNKKRRRGCRLQAFIAYPFPSPMLTALGTTVSLSLHPLHYTLLIARNLGRISDFNLPGYNAPRATDLQISLVSSFLLSLRQWDLREPEADTCVHYLPTCAMPVRT